MPGLTLNPRQRLPKGWRFGATQRGPDWSGAWVVGPHGRRLVVRFDACTYPLEPDAMRQALCEQTTSRDEPVRRAG
jgi:hypothetical protein